MFFTDTFSDTMSAVGRKKHSKHSYRGGFGVSYGTGESSLWGVLRTINWIASATFLFSAVEMVQAHASYPDPLATRCIICLAYLFAFFSVSVVSTHPSFWANNEDRPLKRMVALELTVELGAILYALCFAGQPSDRLLALAAGCCAVLLRRSYAAQR